MKKTILTIVTVAFLLIINNANAQWTDAGTVVHLTTATDSVGAGTSSPAKKVHVLGSGTGTPVKLQYVLNTILQVHQMVVLEVQFGILLQLL